MNCKFCPHIKYGPITQGRYLDDNRRYWPDELNIIVNRELNRLSDEKWVKWAKKKK